MSEIHDAQAMRKGEASAEPPALRKFWLGDHPRPCTCLHGPCEGGENGCGYDPAAWDAWEESEQAKRAGVQP